MVLFLVNLDNLFKRINDLGLTAKAVSDATGISTGNISDWKSGRSLPTATKLVILADYLNCSVDYLLGRTQEPTEKGFADIISSLDEEQLRKLLSYMDFLKTQQDAEEKKTDS